MLPIADVRYVAAGLAAVMEPGRGPRRYLLTGIDTPGAELAAALRRVTGRRLIALHAERALALLAVTVAAFSILVQVARGRLPIELSTSGLRYEAEAADDVAVAVAELQDQVDDLVATVDALADRLDRPQQRP